MRHCGALVLGAFEGNELAFIGHVGDGFGAGTLRDISERLAPPVRKKCPFRTAPAVNEPGTWVKPELVCEVAFARHPYARPTAGTPRTLKAISLDDVPVKGSRPDELVEDDLSGISLQSSEVEERRLKYDRRWVLVDESKTFITHKGIFRKWH